MGDHSNERHRRALRTTPPMPPYVYKKFQLLESSSGQLKLKTNLTELIPVRRDLSDF